jgi:hypothetical protein
MENMAGHVFQNILNFFILNLYLYFLNYFNILLKINYKNKKTLKINRFPPFLSKHAIKFFRWPLVNYAGRHVTLPALDFECLTGH